MASLWWKFTLGSAGAHLFRVQNPGISGQAVWLDGAPVDAPEGTLTFTGPAASLLELQNTDAGWILLVDGTPVDRYSPGDSDLADFPAAVTWFRFSLLGAGTHHLRVTNIGSPSQEVFLDAAPLEAPPGTMTFTGPAASLLELQRRDGVWVLVADGAVVHPHNPNVDESDPVHIWNFTLQATGIHQLHVAHIGKSGQEIILDGTPLAAPEGTTTFTGPEASLLQLVQQDDRRWVLLVDGIVVEASSEGALYSERSWTFLAPQTGTAHQLRASNMGKEGQEVVIDGVVLPAPVGTTMFTGPGGALLELRPVGVAWVLFVDGVGVEDFNARSSTLTGDASGALLSEKRSAVATGTALPQGVSHDSETGMYKANIKLGGRFKFLGDFATPEQAHSQYLAAKKEFDGK
mmetsp:Transcript_99182/g.285283  ORF Transcript_99182/g.285283 Transcript_99182/m.285283 type:complete len:404 (-) Transcript_99182:79-1290(-)|eukprot:CAMPEP_0177165178 /NCGR_PEP_ID=MMETSP0367-20130122/7355_1 /TAXON_ID=447022 ORGANISM="Scrippsiella hangoei-like, Strain SHHI-4" /NCGR_SAMPLE_ID=MMETSP0367 /ASSEMBLY_ACC=CAM_ASM_000362 /LENGTH=403 /DNA_ID=CAMNT_0018611149 /DNA_START=85 /DNA_END=1296 /DNA_ORIENTATION=+